MALIRLVHVQSYLDETMMNRYFYDSNAVISVPVLNDLMAIFAVTVVPLVKNLQSQGVTHLRLEAFEVNGFNFAILNLTGSGNVVGEASPSWNALSFLLSRTNASTKSGGKRIGGLSEITMINNDVFSDPTYLGFIDDYAEALDDVLTGTLTSFVPQLVKFDPLNPGTVLAQQGIAGASFTGVTTQVTRRPKR